MPQLIIGLVGYAGSGKGAVAKLLQEKYGARLFRFSQALQDILIRIGIDQSRDHLIKLSEALRHAFGEDILTRAIERDIAASDAHIVILDGVRRLNDMLVFETKPQFHLIEVAAPDEIRFQRLKRRGEKTGEASLTLEQFLRDNTRSTEVSIASVIAHASRTIDNSGTPQELEEKVDRLMKEFQE